MQLLRDAAIVHLHHFFELDQNPFGINFLRECRRARFIRQFHTHPLTIAHGDEICARTIVESPIPQLVIGQYHERCYPRARVVPNIVPVEDDRYTPILRAGTDPVVFFAPTVDYPATDVDSERTRWETKGARETVALLYRVVETCGKGRIVVRTSIPHDQCLREKQASDIAIDEMVTGSFHLTGLEALAQGLPTFAYLDARCLDTLAELVGTCGNPWLNFRLEEAEKPLIELINDGELRREMGAFARDWMEKHYSDREMVNHYVRAYEDLLNRPERFEKSRLDPSSRRQVFLAQKRDDLMWEQRKARISAMNRFSCVELNDPQVDVLNRRGRVPHWIKAPVHNLLRRYTSVRMDEVQAAERRYKAAEKLLEFVAADETNRWLYVNRQERMDATVDIFENTRREFHLDRYCFAAKRVHGKRVLDCASGTGYGVRLLTEKGRTDTVIGIDVDVNAVAYAVKKHHIKGTVFLCASGDRMPLPNACVDVITCFETIEHVPDDAALVSELHRVLTPGGLLIISTPNQWSAAVSPFHLREYDRRSFMRALEPWFECIELYNQNSGTGSPYNHGQPPGIIETRPENESLAECYIAVCRRKL